MFQVFSKNRGTSICVESQETAVLLAAENLQRDLQKLSNNTHIFPLVAAAEGPAIRIRTGEGAPDGYESYQVRVSSDGVEIAGSDVLGTVYGIYSFCDRVLNISPMHLFTDIFPETVESLTLENMDYCADLPKTRFRGWFINDEDLLTDFKAGGGSRNIDYPFYGHVIHPEVMDMVLETALRCGANLIIPSSFVDVDNPDEEKLVRAACDRGLYVSQHHIEPMGVSYCTAENYLKKRGMKAEISYVKNPQLMEEMWRYYARLWSAYGDRVVWQLGLRGKGDRSVWKSDPNVPGDLESRGALISRAIALQRRIVAETLGTEKFEATTTLWAEGAELFDSGVLKVPEKTTVVFCDIGCNQMFGDDFYCVQRKPDQNYGVYYHVAYWSQGPHLAEGCSPEKMAFSYREAEQRNSLYYSILNVSNIRPTHFSSLMNMEVLRDPAVFDPDAYMNRFYGRVYGGKATAVVEGMKRYYRCFADMGEALMRDFCARHEFHYHSCRVDFVNFAATDGQLCFGKKEEMPDSALAEFYRSAADFEALLAYWHSIRNTIPEQSRNYFEIYQIHQTEYMLLLTKWTITVLEMLREKNASGVAEKEQQCFAILRKILDARGVLEQGRWKGWFSGDFKIGIDNRMQDKTRLYAKKRLEQLRA